MALFLRFETAGAFWDHSSFFVNPDDDALQSLLDERLVPRQICFNHITNTQLWLSIIWKITVTHNSHNVWRTTRWMWSILMVKMIVNTCTTVVLPYGRLIRYKLDAPNPNPKSVERVSLGCEEPGSDIDTFNITTFGLQALQVTQSFSQSSKLSEFVPDSSAMTVSGDFSLILELTKKGWNFEYATPSKKTPAYAPEGAKTWFFHRQNKKGGINTAYLNALCQADSLFGAGLTKIFHFQLKIYYQAIVALPAATFCRGNQKLLSTTFAKTQGFQVQGWKKEETFDTLRWWLRPGKCPNCLCSIIWTQFNLAFHCMLIVVWVWLWPAAPSTQ